MNIIKYILALAFGLFSILFSALTQASVATDPVGFTTLTINGSPDGSTTAFTAISVNLENPVVLKGKFTETPTSNTATDSYASNDVNAYSVTDSVGNGSYYFQITSGSNEGLIFDILSNTSSQYSLSADLSGLVSAGDSYSIKKHTTLGDVFGEDNSAGFKSGGDVGASDRIYIMSTDGSGIYATYYYQTDSLGFLGGDGWRLSGDLFTDVSDVVIGPDDGLFVGRTAIGDLSIIVSGSVNTTDHQRFLPTGYSLVSYPFPVDVTLDELGLYSNINGYVSGGDVASSDRVYVISAEGIFTVYYRQTDALGFLGGDGWRLSGDIFTPYDDEVIPAGSSLVIYHIGTGIDWRDPVPYTLN